MWHLLPQVMPTLKLSALASNKHYHVRKREFGEREGETGRRKASVLQQMAPFFLKLNQESHFELTYPFLWGEAAFKSWLWVLRFCPSVFFLKAAALLHRQSDFRVEEGT